MNRISNSEQQAEKKNKERTCSALRWRLAFPPDVVLIVLIKFAILLSDAVVIVLRLPVLILVLEVVLLPSTRARLLARGRHGRHRVVPRAAAAADRRAGVADAGWAKPLAVWDGGEGWAEARMVVRVVALRCVCEGMCRRDG